MKLYKAIKYDGLSEQKMSSELITNNKDVFDWETLICQAISHISHGDRKTKKKDCWISATYDFKIAYDYLFNEKYNFNGIAVIDLPNTYETGYIFDYNLRKLGFIDKDLVEGRLVSKVNEDGILMVLDMSSEFTVYYLASCLWLKGKTDALGNFRAFRNANKYDEVLILGDNIHFTFIKKDDIASVQLDSYQPENYHSRLFIQILKQMANQEQIKMLFPDSHFFYNSREDELADYIEFEKDILREIANDSDNYFFGDDDLLIDEEEIRKKFLEEKKLEEYKELVEFYENVKQKYFSNNERNRFYEYYRLNYADKDIINFEKYEIVKGYEDVPADYFIAAYVYAGVYMNLKDNSSKRHKLWQILNQICENKYISGTVTIEAFIHDYKMGLGIYPNWHKDEPRNYKREYDDFFLL